VSERLLPTIDGVVVVRERASGRYLASGITWTCDGDGALRLTAGDARELLRRFACEPDGVELVDAAPVVAA
jgi:hypothetical protein